MASKLDRLKHNILYIIFCASQPKQNQTYKHSSRVQQIGWVRHQDRRVRLGVISNGANVLVAGPLWLHLILLWHAGIVPYRAVVIDIQHINDHLRDREHICKGRSNKVPISVCQTPSFVASATCTRMVVGVHININTKINLIFFFAYVISLPCASWIITIKTV